MSTDVKDTRIPTDSDTVNLWLEKQKRNGLVNLKFFPSANVEKGHADLIRDFAGMIRAVEEGRYKEVTSSFLEAE